MTIKPLIYFIQALKPDGAFICSMFGAETLQELRYIDVVDDVVVVDNVVGVVVDNVVDVVVVGVVAIEMDVVDDVAAARDIVWAG